MGETHPPLIVDLTVVALPFVSKQGFTGATVSSLILAMASGGLRHCKFLFLGDHTQVGARNAACEMAISEGAQYLLFIDSDMDFPTDTLKRLKDCEADVACTDMWSRNVPSFRTVLRAGPKDEHGKIRMIPYAGSGIEAVDVCGMACTLIRTSLLLRMRDKLAGNPWFQSASHGEDASFCFLARDLCGATIKCDYGITAGHWGVARMAGQEWTRDADNNPMKAHDPEFVRRMGAANV